MAAAAETTADPAIAAEYRALAAKWFRLAIEAHGELISADATETTQSRQAR